MFDLRTFWKRRSTSIAIIIKAHNILEHLIQGILPGVGAVSDSELLEDLRSSALSPRVSMSAAEDDPPSGPSTPKRKFSKFNIGKKKWCKML